MNRTAVGAAVAVALAVTLGACGSATTGDAPVAAVDAPVGRVDPVPVAPATTSALVSDRLSGTAHFGSLRLDPPPASVTAGVSLAEVQQRFESEQLFPASGSDAPHQVRLASYRDQLVWAYIYPDVARRQGAGGPAIRDRSEEPAVPAERRCSFVVLFDAGSGGFIAGHQNCWPAPVAG